MSTTQTLPLYPLEGFVLLPTLRLQVTPVGTAAKRTLEQASYHNNLVVASFYEEEAVHEIGVRALVTTGNEGEGSVIFEGLARCRLLKLLPDVIPMVVAEDLPEQPVPVTQADFLRNLLLRRFGKLFSRLQRLPAENLTALSLDALTWRLTAELNLELSHQQGLLNVPDAVTRGKILLLALRDLERRERFLRPYARLRHQGHWN